MSLWLELHCDNKSALMDCASNRGDIFGTLSRNNAKSVTASAAHLREEAKRRGWKYTMSSGWLCPICQTKGEAT